MPDTAREMPVPPRRFLILGLPRSGTTYLMTLLNAHSRVCCSGELYNPYAVVGVKERREHANTLTARDRRPMKFLNDFFARHSDGTALDAVGFKFMIGHNITVLSQLATLEDLTLIYVHRDNRLAQISSLIKATETKRWAQARKDAHIDRKIAAGPREVMHLWHEYATMDYLFADWFDRLPQEKFTLEYRDLFARGFKKRICSTLGLDYEKKMKSPLVKQGSNQILDRFKQPDRIERYFRRIGYERWLEDEI